MAVATDRLADRYAAVRQVMTPRGVFQSDLGRKLGLC